MTTNVTLNCLGFPSQKQVVRFTTLALTFVFATSGLRYRFALRQSACFKVLLLKYTGILFIFTIFVPIILSFLSDETLPQQKHPVNVFARGERITCTPTRKKRRRLLRRAFCFAKQILRYAQYDEKLLVILSRKAKNLYKILSP